MAVASRFHSLLHGLAAEHAKLLGENQDLRAQLENCGETAQCSQLRCSASAPVHPFGVGADVAAMDYPVRAPSKAHMPPALVPPEGNPPALVGAGAGGFANLRRPELGAGRSGTELWGRVRDHVKTGEVTVENFQTTLLRNGSKDLEVSSVWAAGPAQRKSSKMAPMVLGNPSNSSSSESSIRRNNTNKSLRRMPNHYWVQTELEETPKRRGLEQMLKRLVMKPDDRRHLAWDLTSIIFLSYDILGTPMDVFNPPDSDFKKAMDITTLIFWTIDIAITFFCGYHTVKSIEMRPSRIACHYFRTWFLIDFSIVMMEWLSVGEAGILRLGKFARGARVIRMLRIIKVQVLFEELNDFIRSETTLMAFQIGRLVIFILVINHFVACGWWAMGTYIEDVSVRWTDRVREADDSLGYAYFTSLHWALTQFTPASMEVAPTNVWERAYTILVLMMGLGAFSSFLASISSLMTQLRQLKATQHREDLLIRRYLMEHGVSMELGNHIMFFFRENRKFVKRKRLSENDVKAFDQLPESLKIKLHWEVYERVITPHPLFFHLNVTDHNGLVEICHRSMSERILGAGHELFHFGKIAEKMYFVGKGTLDYHPGSDQQEGSITEVGSNHWLSEMVLWMSWIHRGTISATTPVDMVELESVKFHEHVKHRGICFDVCRHYARLYVQKIAELTRGGDEELPEDIWGDLDDLQHMVHLTTDGLNRTAKKSVAGVLGLLLHVFSENKEGAAGLTRRSSTVTTLAAQPLSRSATSATQAG